jgi:acetylserotonin N-methyltransferase
MEFIKSSYPAVPKLNHIAENRKAIRMAHEHAFPDPSVVVELIEAFRRSKVMFASVSLGVFDVLAAGPRSAKALAEELHLNPDAVQRLLDACVNLHLLIKDREQYANAPVAMTYLCRGSPRRLTGYIHYSNAVLWKLWADLEGAIREGTNRWQQAFGWDGPIFANLFHSEEAKREFLMGMHGFGLLSSPEVVAAFDLSRFHCVVDLGGATGHLAITACQRYPGLRAIVFDLPAAVPLAREIIAASPVADRVEVAAGDFFVDPLPEGDLFAVGRILHDWSDEKIRVLLQKMYQRLPAGGGLLVAEKLLTEDKTGPTWALMQSLNMLVGAEGKERTLREYVALLKEAGFAEIEGRRTSGPLDAVLAIKDRSRKRFHYG